MSQQVAYILEEISRLAPQETTELYHEIGKRIDRQEKVRIILEKYRGNGAGVWLDEPQ